MPKTNRRQQGQFGTAGHVPRAQSPAGAEELKAPLRSLRSSWSRMLFGVTGLMGVNFGPFGCCFPFYVTIHWRSLELQTARLVGALELSSRYL